MSSTFGDAFLLAERKQRFEIMMEQIMRRTMGDDLPLGAFLMMDGRFSDARLKRFVNEVVDCHIGVGLAGCLNHAGADVEDVLDEPVGEDRDMSRPVWNGANELYAAPSWFEDYLYCAVIAVCASRGLLAAEPTLATLYSFFEPLDSAKAFSGDELAAILAAEAALDVPSDEFVKARLCIEDLRYYDAFSTVVPAAGSVTGGESVYGLRSALAELDASYLLAFQKPVADLFTREQKAFAASVCVPAYSELDENDPDLSDEELFEYLKDDLELLPKQDLARAGRQLAAWRRNIPYLKIFEQRYRRLRKALLVPDADWTNRTNAQTLKDAVRLVLCRRGYIELGDTDAYFNTFRCLSNALHQPQLSAVRTARFGNGHLSGER